MQSDQIKTGEIMKKAKVFLATNKYHPLLIFAAFLAIVLLFVMLIIAVANITALLIYLIILAVVFYVLTAPVKYSVSEFYLRSYNLKYEENFKFFEGFKSENFFRSILLLLIKTGLTLAGLILLIVPGVIFMLRASMAYYILRDNPKIKPWDSVKLSNELFKGHNSEFLKLAASYIGWFLLGLITFGIVFIYVLPYYETAKSIFYRNVLRGLNDDQLSSGLIIPEKKTVLEQKTEVISSKNVESEIEDLNRRIRDMEKGGGKKVEVLKQEKAKNIEVDETDYVYSGGIDPTKYGAIPEDLKTGPKQPLLMDEIDAKDVLVSSEVEEIELLNATTKAKESQKKAASKDPVFVSREIEIMEGESFDDFRTRVERLRKEREEGHKLTVMEQNIQPPPQPQPEPSKNEELKKLSRAELIEKLRKDREKKETK